ncbi:MAG: hypothetical protein IPH28_24360 [Cytophagaceae bacterium]|nr:hypothetical protein [Cytophagaceae bacterium]
MTATELKVDLYRIIENLKLDQLNEVSGLIKNYVHSSSDEEAEWNSMSDIQKEGLLQAKYSIQKNNGTIQRRHSQ